MRDFAESVTESAGRGPPVTVDPTKNSRKQDIKVANKTIESKTHRSLPGVCLVPWAAGAGEVSLLRIDLMFDGRCFQASSELNLLNTLLLASA